jgi:hypothetical protein
LKTLSDSVNALRIENDGLQEIEKRFQDLEETNRTSASREEALSRQNSQLCEKTTSIESLLSKSELKNSSLTALPVFASSFTTHPSERSISSGGPHPIDLTVRTVRDSLTALRSQRSAEHSEQLQPCTNVTARFANSEPQPQLFAIISRHRFAI